MQGPHPIWNYPNRASRGCFGSSHFDPLSVSFKLFGALIKNTCQLIHPFGNSLMNRRGGEKSSDFGLLVNIEFEGGGSGERVSSETLAYI